MSEDVTRREIAFLRDKLAGLEGDVERLSRNDQHQDAYLLKVVQERDTTRTRLARLESQVEFLQGDYRDRKASEAAADRRCGNCGEVGHYRTSCPRLQACSYCGQKGHKQPSCPRRQACSNCGKKGHKRPRCPELQEA